MNFKTFISTAVVATVLTATSAFANDVEVSNAWARASAGMAKAGGAFLTIHNPNDHDHALINASADVAARVELHTHTMVDGMMQMRQVEGGINVPAGETVTLQPGGFHVMLMGLHAPLKEGDTFPLTLTFTGDRTTTIDVKILAPTAMGFAGQATMGQNAMGHGHEAMGQHMQGGN